MKTIAPLSTGALMLLLPFLATAQVKTYSMEPVPHAAYDPAKIDEDIQFHEQMVRRDPKGAIAWSMLSGAYLARSRESDSDVFAWKAEDAARMSLKCRKKGNVVAAAKLVQSLLEQHRFRDAYSATYGIEVIEPGSDEAKRLRADCLTEMGRYDDALAILDKLPRQDEDTSAMATRAHIWSLKGDHEGAIKLLSQALSVVELNSSIPQPALAWFSTKMATENEMLGNWDIAQTLYEKAWTMNPRSYKITLGLARVAMAKKDYASVDKWCLMTLPIANSLDAVALMGDSAVARGDKAGAGKWYAKCREMYLGEVESFDSQRKGGVFHVKPIDRQFATFAASRGLYLDEAIHAASRDAMNRPDGRAYDNLGWIQWQLGDKANAAKNLRLAAASGMADPMISQHAAMASTTE